MAKTGTLILASKFYSGCKQEVAQVAQLQDCRMLLHPQKRQWPNDGLHLHRRVSRPRNLQTLRIGKANNLLHTLLMIFSEF